MITHLQPFHPLIITDVLIRYALCVRKALLQELCKSTFVQILIMDIGLYVLDIVTDFLVMYNLYTDKHFVYMVWLFVVVHFDDYSK